VSSPLPSPADDLHDELPEAHRNVVLRVMQSVWFRLVVTVGLLAIIASGIDWDQMWSRIKEGYPGWFLVAVVLVFAALVVGAVRWGLLLRAADVVLTPAQVGRVYAMSTFASTFLPTSVGGDVARALLVARRGRPLVRTTLSIVLDRIAAFAGLIVVALVSWAIDPGAVPASMERPLLLLSAICLAAGLAGLAFLAISPAFFVRRVPARWRAELRDLRDIVLRCARHPGIGIPVLVASVVFQALVVLQLCALARSISVPLTFPVAAVTVTLVTLITLVPLSIAGFGIREGSYVVLLAAVGINATDATLLSLETVAVLFIAALPGAALLVRHGMRPVLEAPA